MMSTLYYPGQQTAERWTLVSGAGCEEKLNIATQTERGERAVINVAHTESEAGSEAEEGSEWFCQIDMLGSWYHIDFLQQSYKEAQQRGCLGKKHAET